MATQGAIGKHKADVLAERLRLINPQASVEAVPHFYAADMADELLGSQPDYVVDAIDNLTAKCHLLAECRKRNIRVVSSLGAAGRMDPTAIAIADLAKTKMDPMALDVRRILRHKYGFPERGPFGIDAVYSTELPREPEELTYDAGRGFRCVCPGGKNEQHSCEERRRIYGTVSFVTGSFGLFCASVVVRNITSLA
jgi:tRNA A37 threonylcarbamoyladenosine dehydratase